MASGHFLAILERALADPGFLDRLAYDPDGALAAAGLLLPAAEAAAVRELAARCSTGPGLVQALAYAVIQHREQHERQGEMST